MIRRPFTRLTLLALVLAGLVAGSLVAPAVPTHAASTLRLSRYFAAPGDQVRVIGYGFGAGDDVVVTMDVAVGGNGHQHVQAIGYTDGNGSFSAAFTVPGGAIQGTYTVTARDLHANVSTQNLNVVPRAVVTVNGAVPTIYVLPSHGFYVGGAGFQAGENVTVTGRFPLYSGGTYVATASAHAASNGRFYETFMRVPAGAKQGAASVTATGDTSHRAARANLNVLYRPSITVAPLTVRPGTSITINGRDFVANSTVRLTVIIARNGAPNMTVSRSVAADGSGALSTTLSIPSNARNNHYTVVSTDLTGGFHAYAGFNVSIHPSLVVEPTTVLAGEAVTVNGSSYGTGASVHVFATFAQRGSARRSVSTYVTTGSQGEFSVHIAVPSDSATQHVTVYAQSGNGGAQAGLQVNAKPLPTSTPLPTATPAPTATSVPVHHKKPALDFSFISVWYHTVRQGTYNHIVIRATIHKTLGIWIHVYFPNGKHIDIYTNTDSNGQYGVQFAVPRNAATHSSNRVVITMQLWKGHTTRKDFRSFTLV